MEDCYHTCLPLFTLALALHPTLILQVHALGYRSSKFCTGAGSPLYKRVFLLPIPCTHTQTCLGTNTNYKTCTGINKIFSVVINLQVAIKQSVH